MDWLLGPAKEGDFDSEQDARAWCKQALCGNQSLCPGKQQQLRALLTSWWLIDIWLHQGSDYNHRLARVQASLHVLNIS